MFEIAVVNEPLVFKPLKFYCISVFIPETSFLSRVLLTFAK